ncbi:MAG: hypothetical protein OEL53_18640 [Rhodospirillales bacterium]|nr:hypothetical protein [Rhodospirillales bacterium]
MAEILPLKGFEDTNRDELPETLYRRFGQEEYAQDFLAGKILFRSLIYYQRLEEKDSSRGDAAEGSFRFSPEDGTIIQIQSKDGAWHTIGGVENIGSKLPNPEHFFICCLSFRLRPEQNKFGGHLVTIMNPSSFIERLTSGPVKKGHMSWSRVTYYDETEKLPASDAFQPYHQPLWMRKRIKFRDEQEFRIAFQVGDIEEQYNRGIANARAYQKIEDWLEALFFRFEIGDISDLAKVTLG